jgi:hypothetical protein
MPRCRSRATRRKAQAPSEGFGVFDLHLLTDGARKRSESDLKETETILAPGRREGGQGMRLVKRIALIAGSLAALALAGGAHWRF